MNIRPAIAAKSAVLLAFPLVLAAGLSACSASASISATTSPTFSGSKLAANVQKQLMDSNPGLKVTGTTCDDTKKIDTGVKTSCSTTINGKAADLLVTWKNAKGDYSVATV